MGNLLKGITNFIGDIAEGAWKGTTSLQKGLLTLDFDEFKKAFSYAGKVWSTITPWNDNTTSGKILNAATIALLTYGFGSGLGVTAAGEGAVEGTIIAGIPEATGATASTTAASTAPASNSIFSTALNFADKHPFLASAIVGGGLSSVGGVFNYLGQKEMANKQEEIANKQMDRQYSYSGSISSSPSSITYPSDKMKLPVVIQDIVTKLQTDPEYRRGFSTVAAKMMSGKLTNDYMTFYDQMSTGSVFRG